jgi:hypothetical protein
VVRWLISKKEREEHARDIAYMKELEHDIAKETAHTAHDERRAKLLAEAKSRNHVVESLVLGFKLRGHGV